MAAEFDPFNPEVRIDPYPWYRRIREAEPVHQSLAGYWFVSAFAEADSVLRDRRFGRDFSQFLDVQMGGGQLRDLFNSFLFFMDPPSHTRLRTLVAGAFTRDSVRRLRPNIEAITEALIAAARAKASMDVILDLAEPLPIQVICELLGLPESDRKLIHGWSRDLSAALEFVLTPEIVDKASAAALEATAYFRELISDRRRRPQDALIDRLIAVEIDGETLTEREIIGTSIFLFGAGHETTTCLIGNAVLALLDHPAEREKLLEDPSLAPRAVEEFLRFDSPVQMTGRIAREDVTLGGRMIAAGNVVIVVLGAANRDPARFQDPDRLDIIRPNNTSLSFGGGIHFCLGSMLARAEAEIAIPALLRTFPKLRLRSDTVSWRTTLVLRGATSLPIEW